MSAPNLVRVPTSCARGINQAEDNSSLLECADARNVWAPNGTVEQRPGYVGRTVWPTTAASSVMSAGMTTCLVENPSGVFTTGAAFLTLSNLPVGARWYAGLSASDTSFFNYGAFIRFSTFGSEINTNDVAAQFEYWNGDSWVLYPGQEFNSTNYPPSSLIASRHLGSYPMDLFGPSPRDWATTTVNSISAYWLRITMLSVNGSTQLSTPLLMSSIGSFQYSTGKMATPVFMARFAGGAKRYIVYVPTFTDGVLTQMAIFSSSNIVGAEASSDYITDSTNPPSFADDEPASVAVVAETGEAFVAYNRFMGYHKQNPSATDDYRAQVETADFAIGANAPYDKNFIGQSTTFPQAKYLLYAQSRIWYATDGGVGWSAPVPYHKVFPLLSLEPLDHGGDNSPVTGLAALGENVVVFKQNSIWVMTLVQSAEDNQFGLSVFKPIKRVSGIGCLSNASIRQIRGRLIFLGHDGLYAFDGVTAKKISAKAAQDGQLIERLSDFWDSITPSRRVYAVAADWQSQGHYLLSVSVDGSLTNNRVIAWDYDNDAFWIWDDIPAAGWIEDNDTKSDPKLFFYDVGNRVFEFGKGNLDNGATITSWVTTQPLLLKERARAKLREVVIVLTNVTYSVTVDIYPEDATVAPYNGETTISTVANTEKLWGELKYDVDSWVDERRRQVKVDTNIVCDYCKVKVTHSQKGVPFLLNNINAGFLPIGNR